MSDQAPIRVIILTSSPHGTASRCLPVLAASDRIRVVSVVLAGDGGARSRRRRLSIKIRKAFRIGPLGALNGMRIRRWFNGPPTSSIEDLCAQWSIPLHRVERIGCKQTVRLFQDAGADLGLSLGNGYIPRKVFQVPRHGMLNVHTERLPFYQNAQGVIWPIFNMERTTGVTIHQIDDGIDTGPILSRTDLPIRFQKTLKQTVIASVAAVCAEVPGAVLKVCETYESLRAAAAPQSGGRRYTTPSLGAFMTMMRNNRRLFRNPSDPDPPAMSGSD